MVGRILDFVSGLHNFFELSQPLVCLYQVLQTQKTFSIASIAQYNPEFLSHGATTDMLYYHQFKVARSRLKKCIPTVLKLNCQERLSDAAKKKKSLSSDVMSLIGREWQRNEQKPKTHVQSVQNYMVKYANLWPSRDKTLQKGEKEGK